MRPGYELFSAIARGVETISRVHECGVAVRVRRPRQPGDDGQGLRRRSGFVFAFTALPTIIFVSSFFTVLYYFGILQFVVRSWRAR